MNFPPAYSVEQMVQRTTDLLAGDKKRREEGFTGCVPEYGETVVWYQGTIVGWTQTPEQGARLLRGTEP